MKQKTFEFDDRLAAEFEGFCRRMMMVEKRVAAAAVLHFIEADAQGRERILLRLDEWLHEQPPYESPRDVVRRLATEHDKRIAAKEATPPHVTRARKPKS